MRESEVILAEETMNIPAQQRPKRERIKDESLTITFKTPEGDSFSTKVYRNELYNSTMDLIGSAAAQQTDYLEFVIRRAQNKLSSISRFMNSF